MNSKKLTQLTMKIRLAGMLTGLFVFYTVQATPFGEMLSDSTCNAGFTYELDTADPDLPVYTFTAEETDESKTFIWNFGGSLERTAGREIKQIFFDPGDWQVTLSVMDEQDSCSSSQNVSVVAPAEGSCFFNVWKTGDLSIEVETWLPAYWEDMSYSLDFGDGDAVVDTAEFGMSVAHTYEAPGTYQLCQTMIVDSCTYCKYIQIGAGEDTTSCNAAFTYEVDSASSASYVFTAVAPHTLLSFLWTIEGGFQATGPELEYTFPDGGLWNVTLAVMSGEDTCSTTQVVSVTTSPDTTSCNAAFTYSRADSGNLSYLFIAEVSDIFGDYHWDFGDGTSTFSDSSKIAHTFTSPGTYEVCLEVTDETDSCRYCQTLEVDPISDSLTISGRLFADLTPVDNGVIVLYLKKNGGWKKVKHTYSESGYFSFGQLSEGDYLMHARSNGSVDERFVPTYFVNGISWRDAYKLTLSGSVSGLNITLIRFQLIGSIGQGFLSGSVNTDQPGTDEEYVILLKDKESDRVLRWTVAQGIAQFDFKNLPYGTYEVTLEKPSYSVSEVVQLSEDHPGFTGLVLNPDVVTSADKENKLDFVNIYPTKVDNRIFVSNTGHKPERLHLELYNISGEVLLDASIALQVKETKELPFPGVVEGLYLLKVINEEGESKTIRLMK